MLFCPAGAAEQQDGEAPSRSDQQYFERHMAAVMAASAAAGGRNVARIVDPKTGGLGHILLYIFCWDGGVGEKGTASALVVCACCQLELSTGPEIFIVSRRQGLCMHSG